MTANYQPLWHWVREREAIKIKKDAGQAFPWTDDEILRTYRFCNVRREDDRGTVWIRQHIREPYADHPHLWFMLCIARWINWPDTLNELMEAVDSWPSDDGFNLEFLAFVLNDRKALGKKVYTGAYMITAPSKKGTDKQKYIAETVLGAVWKHRGRFADDQLRSIQGTHTMLRAHSGWGEFMAYQVVVDMRFTRLLRDATDRDSWTAAGPGTIRGLNRLHGRKLDHPLQQWQARDEMRAIFKIAQAETGVAMDFSDVPNILCETDKYLRVKNGEGKPRALYVPGRGS